MMRYFDANCAVETDTDVVVRKQREDNKLNEMNVIE